MQPKSVFAVNIYLFFLAPNFWGKFGFHWTSISCHYGENVQRHGKVSYNSGSGLAFSEEQSFLRGYPSRNLLWLEELCFKLILNKGFSIVCHLNFKMKRRNGIEQILSIQITKQEHHFYAIRLLEFKCSFLINKK